MRKLATIRKILRLRKIEGADLILLAEIDGWQCIVKKDEFKEGDLCVYYEIDSFLPLRPEYEHLRQRAYKRMGDLEGIRIKTIKLKGHLSQGLALPVTESLRRDYAATFPYDYVGDRDLFIGLDVTDLLGVQKYEPPVPSQVAGQVHGNFPGFIPRTDEERCQNLVSDIFEKNIDSRYEVSMKLDGTSFTAFLKDSESGVCSRNWRLKIDEENQTNSLVRMFIDSGLQKALENIGRNVAVQGELMGPGIQKNRENLQRHRLYVFRIFDIDRQKMMTPKERHSFFSDLVTAGMDRSVVEHVPVLTLDVSLKELGISNIHELLTFAEGPSISHPIREGLVFKRVDGEFSFKAISNRYLLKEED